MKVCFATVFVLAVAASIAEGGNPLKYTEQIAELCQFYHGMYLLSDEENVKKFFQSHGCDDCCVDEISVHALSLWRAFSNSYSEWKDCGERQFNGCCLGVESSTYQGKQTRLLWPDCFFHLPKGKTWDEQDQKIVKKLLSTGGALVGKWKDGVELELENGNTNCEYTKRYIGWSDIKGEIGGVFNVEVNDYLRDKVVIKLDETSYLSGSLHRLLCAFSRTTYEQGIQNHVEGCEGVCVKEKHLPNNVADTTHPGYDMVNGDARDNENQDVAQTSDEPSEGMELKEATKKVVVEDNGTAGAYVSSNKTLSASTYSGVTNASDEKLKEANVTEKRAVEDVRAALVSNGVCSTHKVAYVRSLCWFITSTMR
ncbi:hypothetical protein TRVL_03651 [Trypanosoma vivax]|nr:hypothetical protein TRVL_03651 [Trypanosoma vivax]